MKRFIFLFLIGFGTLSLASEKLTVADLSDPKHPTYTLTDLSIEDAEYAIGEPANGRKVIIEKNGKLSWSGKSISQIDRENGGDGHPEIKLHMGERKVIELFEHPKKIIPLSGKWKTLVQPKIQKGKCMFLPLFMQSSPDISTKQSVKIQNPFHPDQIMNPSKGIDPSIRWQKNGINSWKCVLISEEEEGDIMRMTWKVKVLNPQKIRFENVLYMKGSMDELGDMRCTIIKPVVLQYIGR